jgi:uncharacterized membrane protein
VISGGKNSSLATQELCFWKRRAKFSFSKSLFYRVFDSISRFLSAHFFHQQYLLIELLAFILYSANNLSAIIIKMQKTSLEDCLFAAQQLLLSY